MKKVFAVMSTLLLTLACVGLLSNAPVAASEGKFVEDPTLAEDEIPMYIMGSIYTTFPNYYDNEAEADPLWGGAARMYPWNETRLRVAQFDENGKATGKYYAVYFAGSLKHLDANGDPSNGAGKNVLFYTKADDGSIQLSKMELGKWYHNRNAGDPSLSHMNTNNTGEDIVVDMKPLFAKVNDGADYGRMYNRILVFDGEGRAIRGTSGDPYFAKAGSDGASEVVFAPEYCYVDGKVVKYVEGVTVPDKVMKEKVDEDGNVVLDEEGNPVMEATDEDKFLYQRFTWEWFAERPENVNEVGYLDEGWDAMKWDYCYEQDGGYMCIAFTAGEGTNEKLNEAQLAVYNETLKAQWIADGNAEADFVAKTTADAVRRECIREFRIPAGGFTYDFGYLDKGVASLYACYNDMFKSAYYYGRTEDFAAQRTYNFSTSGLLTQDVVRNETSYRIMDENNTIEVIQGDKFIPANNIIYTGVTRFWDKGADGTENKLDGYVASDDACEYYIKLDGNTVVQPAVYPTFEAMKADFFKDLNAYMAVREGFTLAEDGTVQDKADGTKYVEINADGTFSTSCKLYQVRYEIAHDSNTGYDTFVRNDEMWAKWQWFFEYLNMKGNCFNVASRLVNGSIGNFGSCLWHFFNEGYRSGWPTSIVDWSNGAAREWLEVVKFGEYEIDTTGVRLETTLAVEFIVKNVSTNNTSSMVINYKVTDAYTPFIEINEKGLNIESKVVDGKVVINGGKSISKYALLNAYDGEYYKKTGDNKVDIKGMDITQKVQMTSDTLDFDKPTEGTHRITATVYGASGKLDVVQFTVTIRDRTAPIAAATVETVNVQYGSHFDPKVGIVTAQDNVDGNLFNATHDWCIDMSSTPVDTTKPGKYTVVVQVYDKAGNSTKVSYNVFVGEAPLTADDIKDIEDDLADVVDQVEDVTDQLGGLDSIMEKLEALSSSKGCGKSSAAFVVQLLSVTSLLVLVLRKRH